MKSFYKKLTVFMIILLSISFASFSKEKEMSLLELNKTVLELKYELYQIDHRFGEFEEMNGLKLKFEKGKRERLLEKYQAELKERNAENTEKAKEAAEQAVKDFQPKLKEMAEQSKKLGAKAVDAVSNFLKDMSEKAEDSEFLNEIKENIMNMGK